MADGWDRGCFSKAVEHIAQRREFVFALVVETKGSTPRKAGAKMLIGSDGKTQGTVGGGSVESGVVDHARRMLEERLPPGLRHFDLTEHADEVCGGKISVYMEAFFSPRELVIFGAGHVAAALCPLLVDLGFDVTVYDPREKRLELEAFGEARRIVASFDEVSDHLDFHSGMHLLVMTPDHRYDFDVVRACVDRDWAFLGVLGSMKKRKDLLERLSALGVAEDRIEAIRIPLGLNIGSETPAEIAVSIAAELIQRSANPKKLGRWT